jgi:hypothetical protein
LEHDPEKLQTFRTKIMPEKLSEGDRGRRPRPVGRRKNRLSAIKIINPAKSQ